MVLLLNSSLLKRPRNCWMWEVFAVPARWRAVEGGGGRSARVHRMPLLRMPRYQPGALVAPHSCSPERPPAPPTSRVAFPTECTKPSRCS